MSKNSETWWRRTLATAPTGEAVQVEEIFSAPLRQFLQGRGIEAGSTLTCLDNQPFSIMVQSSEGSRTQISRDHAWFISITDEVG